MSLTEDSYIKSKKLGEGTYASIYLGFVAQGKHPKKIVKKSKENKKSSLKVALKKIKITEFSQGQEVSAIREIKALKSIKNEYVINLIDIFKHKFNLYLVLEYVELDLEKIIKNKSIVIMPPDIKSWVFMLLSALKSCHDSFYIHRDIKPNNILLKCDGTLKLADFGLTRKISNIMTPSAAARWYRAPEMLVGKKCYSFKTDIWSIGAVFAELFLRVPLFAGETDLQQLDLICKVLGTPKETEDEVLKLIAKHTAHYPAINLKSIFTAATEDALDLLKQMLSLDARTRLSADECLNHRYFRTKPYATRIGEFNNIK